MEKKIVLEGLNRKITEYAKREMDGDGNFFPDLQKMISKETDIPLYLVTEKDVYNVVVQVFDFWSCYDKKINRLFWLDLFGDKNVLTVRDAIKHVLNFIRMVQVKGRSDGFEFTY